MNELTDQEVEEMFAEANAMVEAEEMARLEYKAELAVYWAETVEHIKRIAIRKAQPGYTCEEWDDDYWPTV